MTVTMQGYFFSWILQLSSILSALVFVSTPNLPKITLRDNCDIRAPTRALKSSRGIS